MLVLFKNVFYFHFYLFIPLTTWMLIWIIIVNIPVKKANVTKHCCWLICLAGLIGIPLLLAGFSFLKTAASWGFPEKVDYPKLVLEPDKEIPAAPPENGVIPGQKLQKTVPEKENQKYIIRQNQTISSIFKTTNGISGKPELGADNPLFMVVADILGGLCLAGSLLFLIKIMVDYILLRKIRKIAIPVDAPAIVDLFYALLEEMQIKWPVRLFQSQHIKIPVSFGFGKSYIVLPAFLINQGDFSLIRAVLIHELAHIQRRDWVLLVFRRCLAILFYYHPLTWYIDTALAECQEDICDAWVVELGMEKKEYARKLVEFIYVDWDNVPFFASTIMHWPGKLKNRIRTIINSGTPGKRKLGSTPGILLFAVSFLFIISISLLWGEYGRIPSIIDPSIIINRIKEPDAAFFTKKKAGYIPEDLKIIYELGVNTLPTEAYNSKLESIKDLYLQKKNQETREAACKAALKRLDDPEKDLLTGSTADEKNRNLLHFLLARLYYTIPLMYDASLDETQFLIVNTLLEKAKQVRDFRLAAAILSYPQLTGNYQGLIYNLEAAQQIYEKLKDDANTADILFQLGTHLFSDEEYGAAGKCFTQAADKYTQTGDTAKVTISRAAAYLANYKKAGPGTDFIAYGYNGFAFTVNRSDLFDKYSTIYGKKFSQSSFAEREIFEYFPWSFQIMSFLAPLLLKDGLEQPVRLELNPDPSTPANDTISSYAEIRDRQAECVVPFRTTPVICRQIHYTQSNVPENNGAPDFEKQEIQYSINFWFAEHIGLVKYVYTEGDEQFSWELADFVSGTNPDSARSYFPAAPGMQWDYIYRELSAAGIEQRFHLECTAAEKGELVFSLASIALKAADGKGFIDLGRIKTASGKQYICYHEKRGRAMTFYFDNPYHPGEIEAARLTVQFTNNDPIGYLRASCLSLNRVPDSAADQIGVHTIGPGQVRGFAAQPGETVEWEMDMKNVEYPNIQNGSFFVNLLEQLRTDENSLSAWGIAQDERYGSMISVRLKVKPVRVQ